MTLKVILAVMLGFAFCSPLRAQDTIKVSKGVQTSTQDIILEKGKIDHSEFFLNKKSSYEFMQLKIQQLQEKQGAASPIAKQLDLSSASQSLFALTIPRSGLEDLPLKRRLVIGPSQYDSRVEIREIDPQTAFGKGVLINAAAVAIVVEKDKLHQIAKDAYQLDISSSLGKKYQLCPGESFITQPVLGSGTAFLIGKDRMITAGHVFSGKIQDYAVIFGFELANQAGGIQSIIAADSVYFPTTIIHHSDELDLTAFTLDRETTAAALQTGAEKELSNGVGIYMIGHPYGLPKKVAANAAIEDNTGADYFYTSLDAFQGNSGSPVFSVATHKLIGVLIGGQADFQWQGNCFQSVVCRIPYCTGEKVVRINRVSDWFTQWPR
ncbi:hypothetical protein HDC90_004611 [Pedobacter sp. AK013]|uniref:trypsin-like serine peptidase n=1 Tax=Pedobacter sp. AK013 TaxID=2723071 RepID=UPI001613FEE5|nr:serine protease [Pedobacter sp. AK013]MBB6239949.1 hypothetical protein [Pedobacter sp. AK013]